MNAQIVPVHSDRLRVAFVSGTLGKGGAEKQLAYMVRALIRADVDVRVFSLTKGEFYEKVLEELGCPPQWFGRFSNPVVRMAGLTAALRTFRPHIVHSSHFFANSYALGAAWAYRSISVGSIRSDGLYELGNNRLFGPILLRAPSALISNSYFAPENLSRAGFTAARISVLPNVIDLAVFDTLTAGVPPRRNDDGDVVAIAVTRLYPKKRIDLFLKALAAARRQIPRVRGVVVGDGAEMTYLVSMAESCGLLPNGVVFTGHRNDVPALLKQADMLVLPSDHEGFPNVILEAMAAGLPIVTTPAGDAGKIVQDGVTGYVVPFNDAEQLADRIIKLAKSKEQRDRLGGAGRRCVEERYGVGGLDDRLLSIYRATAKRLDKGSILGILSHYNCSEQRGDVGGVS
jgi:glycosyltransferase involved in cell wall biosynthesis